MICVRMKHVHVWHRTWQGLVVEPDAIGELEGIKVGLFSVVWPGHVRPVLCGPSTVEVEGRSDEDIARSNPDLVESLDGVG